MKTPKISLLYSDSPVYEQYCTHWNGIKKALGKYPHQLLSCRSLDKSIILDQLVKFKPDILIYGLYDPIFWEDWRKKVRQQLPDTKIVVWFCDFPDHTIEQRLDDIDIFFTSNEDADYFDVVKQQGCAKPSFLPQAGNVQLLKSFKLDGKYKDKIVFIGSDDMAIHKERTEFLEEIQKKVPFEWINSTTPVERKAIYQMMPEIYNTAEFVLDLAWTWTVKNYTSNRYWVIPAFGGVSLTKRFPGCEDFYDKESRLYFDDIPELVDVIEFYRNNPELKEKIRFNGMKTTWKRHQYFNRIEQLIEVALN